jgi:F-type H+-transporting ATPase subunit b
LPDMNIPSIYLASSEAATKDAGIFGALGIDWRLLVFQTVAFLLLLVFLRKVVYPPLVKALDERQEKIEAGLQAAKEAEENASKSQEEVEKLLKVARKEADGIIATAKSEAVANIEAAEKKAKSKAERIVAQAHEQLEQDVLAARKALRKDTIELVALATEKIAKTKLDTKADATVIESTLKEVQ